MTEDRGGFILPDVLFVDAQEPANDGPQDSNQDDLNKLSTIGGGWRFLQSSADPDLARDQLDETRCVFMIWSAAAARAAYENLQEALPQLVDRVTEKIYGQSTSIPEAVKAMGFDIVAATLSDPESREAARKPIEDIASDRKPAVPLATKESRSGVRKGIDRVVSKIRETAQSGLPWSDDPGTMPTGPEDPESLRKRREEIASDRKLAAILARPENRIAVRDALTEMGFDRVVAALVKPGNREEVRRGLMEIKSVGSVTAFAKHDNRAVLRRVLQDIGSDHKLAASLVIHANMNFTTMAAVVGVQRGRIVWHDAQHEGPGQEFSSIAKQIARIYSPTGRKRLSMLYYLKQHSAACQSVAKILRQPLTFEEVLREEIILLARNGKVIRSRRQNVFARAHQSQLVGLAFSGGGIRSATFNLGVLQALARHGLLPSFHFMSTVSGGGYIGSWYSAWLRRAGASGVHKRLRSEAPINAKDVETPLEKDWSAITWLRRFSNYLTPQTGLLSIDTWTAVATYLRNLLLNLIILLLALSAILMLPRLFAQLYFGMRDFSPTSSKFHALDWLPIGSTVLMVIALGVTVRELRRLPSATQDQKPDTDDHTSGWVVRWVVLPMFGAAVLMPLWLPTYDSAVWFMAPLNWISGLAALPYLNWMANPYVGWILMGGGVYAMHWCLAALFSSTSNNSTRIHWRRVLGWAFLAGAVGGGALHFLSVQLQLLTDSPAGWIAVLTLGPPATVLILLLTAALHVGLVGRSIAENYRQWWSRLGAWQLILGLGWLVIFALVFYGPAALKQSVELSAALSLSWLTATVAGLMAGRSAGTSMHGKKKILEAIALVAPYVFMFGLLAAVSLATHEVSGWIANRIDCAAVSGIDSETNCPQDNKQDDEARGIPWHDEDAARWLEEHPFLFWLMFVSAGATASLLAWRVDVNEFSMHNFYRNRLVRAYLGASNSGDRNAVPFTGFDDHDDMPLSEFANKNSLQTPIQILNTTLNLTAGEELAWQERKAGSFFFTPFHFGFDPGRFGAEVKETGFRHTPSDRRFTLGTSMAISGAAVNPNMGYHSSTALAFLMTVFNSRLGWWFRNPKHVDWDLPGPHFGLLLLLEELRGASGTNSGYVNLADGGFFENLGIYELVRRRCRFILACDSEADPNYEFNGLGNAIRLCRSDFGIDIQIQLDPIRKQADTGFSRWHCAVGKIRYSEADEQAPDGILVYLKASLTGDEPEDLLNYAARRKGFPHESTADQWFGESQFESYRMLGFHETSAMLEAAAVPELEIDGMAHSEPSESHNIENVFVALRRAWYPPSTAETGSFTRHTERLVRLFDQVRDNDKFAFLDQGLYFDHATKLEADKEAAPEYKREGFYLSSSMIQLMENVYLDLDLEHEWAHPDNRGWMNLFRHWATTPIFRQTWAMSAASYGARFQTFCLHRLRLDLGVVSVRSYSMQEFKDELLSPIEKKILGTIEQYGSGSWPEGTEFHLLQMSVLSSDALDVPPNRFGRMEPCTTDEHSMEIIFGIAFTHHDKEHGKTRLTFFRVRNHLRQLGLARQGLQRLVVDQNVRDIKLVVAPFASAERTMQLKSVFRSVLNEYYRWKDRLMAELYAKVAEAGPGITQDTIHALVEDVEQQRKVSSGTVFHIVLADLEALAGWLSRNNRHESVFDFKDREHKLPKGSIKKLKMYADTRKNND